jgi:hypothetical protein
MLMEWPRTLNGIFRKSEVWAAVGIARADNSAAQYPCGEQHAFLVMVQSDEQHVEERAAAFLVANGWTDVVIERIKLLNQPFHSNDAVMLGCYDAATRKGRAIVIYSDPIPIQ